LSALLAVAAVLAAGIAYLVAPQQMMAALHWWQPNWF
jgi:hypothetical protein